MNIKSLSNVAFDDYESLCIFTDSHGMESLKTDFPDLAAYVDAHMITMDSESILSVPTVVNGKKRMVHILGFGVEMSAQSVMNAFGSMAKKFSGDKVSSVVCHMASIAPLMEQETLFVAAVKGLAAGAYSFHQFQHDKKAMEPQDIVLYTGSETIDSYLPGALAIADSVTLARQLVDEPANLLKPVQLAQKAKEALAGTSVEVTVYDRSQIEAFGMNLYLTVAKGSEAEPQLIVMRYNGDPDSDERIGLIGKGLTYDSGGYSIKPTDSMITMKCDMGGSAAVIGAMTLLAKQQPKINVVGVVAACENMISGRAYLPGDILTSMNGKTVEITNTDAEGRLTLADAMTYAIRNEKATKVVDICTLTGACMVALGEEYAGVVTWQDSLWNTVHEASHETLEACWRLPLNKVIKDKNKGKMADLQNSAGRLAGMETAGSFVGEFTEDKPWIHIDIAGTAYIDHEKPCFRPGATGFGVHLLTELAKRL